MTHLPITVARDATLMWSIIGLTSHNAPINFSIFSVVHTHVFGSKTLFLYILRPIGEN
jgi:hypothetical protein